MTDTELIVNVRRLLFPQIFISPLLSIFFSLFRAPFGALAGGAPAGVSLRTGENDGRLRGRKPVPSGNPLCFVAELLTLDKVNEICCTDFRGDVPDVALVLRSEDIKTVLLNGRSVLPILPEGDIRRCLSREDIKEVFP